MMGGASKEPREEVNSLDALIEALLNEKPKSKRGNPNLFELSDTKAGPKLLALGPELQAEAVARLARRVAELDQRAYESLSASWNPYAAQGGMYWGGTKISREVGDLALRGLLRKRPPLSDETLRVLLDWTMRVEEFSGSWYPLSNVAQAVEERAEEGPLGDDLTHAVEAAISRLRAHRDETDCRKAADRLSKVLGSGPIVHLEPGEAWSDAALADLGAMELPRRAHWNALFGSCQAAGEGKPTARWLKEVRPLIDAVGRDALKSGLLAWLPLVDRPRTQPTERQDWEPNADDLIEPLHVDLLKGLAWCAGLVADRDLARALAALALSAYRKVPGKGPRLVSLGNAAVAALGMMPGMDAVGQLALLKVRVKFIPAQKAIDKALTAAAGRENLPREEIEELAVPAYGMEEVGRRREVLGDHVAELVIEGSDVALRWSKADGKPLKSVPAAAKEEYGDDVKELQASARDVAKMLAAQRERIDGLFLARKRWPFDVWRERYLDHPLIGTIARRLLWHFETNGRAADGIWLAGRIVGGDDRPIDALGESTTVQLWHPIGRPVDDVTAWRDWLERHEVRQPFKQAHREVYVLTDAERATRVYSNRFAAHVLRQHQYHALCAARGWRDKLRLMVDTTYPPTSKDLPEWGLRAEFWVEGIGDNYNQEVSESGAYRYLSTDQVRFYEIGAAQRVAHAVRGGYSADRGEADAEPVPLDRVPSLVLSEVLRDVDLFVGVASIGNDANWSDGGPDGRHIDYWNRYSFGDLTPSGETRKAVLERLIPRLKIAPRCSLSGRYLVVRGDLRTYKIHLGSGNILMEPNDQYLCIVPQQRASERTAAGGVFLPFEGDNVLSIVLSKALMLADDARIDDPTIISQITR